MFYVDANVNVRGNSKGNAHGHGDGLARYLREVEGIAADPLSSSEPGAWAREDGDGDGVGAGEGIEPSSTGLEVANS